MSHSQSEAIRSMHEVASGFERIADIYQNMTRTYKRIMKLKEGFPEDAKSEIKDLMDLVQASTKITRSNIKKRPEEIDIEEIYGIEEQINELRTKYSKTHQKRLEKAIYSPRAGISFLDLIHQTEKVGDHLVNINEAMVGLK